MSDASVVQRLTDHAQHRATIEAMFRSRPLAEIEAEELRSITPHYQQRISEIRQSQQLPGRIVNVKRTRIVDGKTKAADGAYRYEPHERLGRDASVPAANQWPIDGAPYQQEWRLT